MLTESSLFAQTAGTARTDTLHNRLIYPFREITGNPYLDTLNQSPLFLRNPNNIKQEIIYNPKTNTYEFVTKVGNFEYRTPTTLDFEDYRKLEMKKGIEKYWQQNAQTTGTFKGKRLIPKLYIKGKAFEQIFGSNAINIRPQGSAEISFGVLSNFRDDPSLDVRQRHTTNFDFNEKIQMNVTAKIGTKLTFRAAYNTESSFNFENTLKLKYAGGKDDIIQSIEAGNVSLPLNSTLITGAQSLFGVKTKLQFGKTSITAVFSQQQSETKNITVRNGAQQNSFKLTPLDYEDNRHFFISQFFRDHYEKALSTLPIITSDVNITKIEVWVTNIGPATEENRNIIAFTDLGESRQSEIYNKYVHALPNGIFPSNNSNSLIKRLDTAQIRNINTVSTYLTGDPLGIGKNNYFVAGQDFVKLENARRLKPSEYTVNKKLGFISLNTTLNQDQVLAVAVQYTVIGHDSVFQIGEFSDQGVTSPKNLIVKLLKSNTLNTRMPMWNLMMKNVYSIGAYQVQKQGFILNILYSGNHQDIPTGYFTEGPPKVKGVPLIHVLGLDNLDQQLNPIPGGDGFFDFIDGAATQGGTFQASNGRLYFTVLQPFGEYIHDSVFPNNPDLANKYAYDSLYTLTKTGAEQFPDKNKYIIEGYYKSQSGSSISLNAMNVPRGSVKVTAGGVPLTENVDYTVDYTLGRVTILNQGILNSGTPIHVSLENNSLFNLQQKRMVGIHVDHEFNKHLRLGGTILNLHERPLTQKVNYGEDPISNTIWGLDMAYSNNSRWLTRIFGSLPGTNPRIPAKINFNAEMAQFLPGHSKTVGKSGTSYIDDFEGAKSIIDLMNVGSWFLASTPQGQPNLFPEAYSHSGLDYGKNRAKFAWYVIDPTIFYDTRGIYRPKNISKDEISKNSTRQVLETEVFPNKDIPNGTVTNIPVLNLAFYPSERGEYNYDVKPGKYSAGIDADGSLARPETRWGGIMRSLETTDFEAANIQYIEFWMMDPFTEDPNNSGQMYIDLGDVSEDLLRDGRKSYENGLPTSSVVTDVDTTIWGRVPTKQALVESFSNIAGSRQFQDVGYDGLSDKDERSFFKKNYLKLINDRFGTGSEAYKQADKDPSSDDYHYYRGTDYDSEPLYSSISERYKNYNGPEGNSPTNAQNTEPYKTSATNLPNQEDINHDNTLSESERYFQYKINLNPAQMVVGQNYIADVREAGNIRLPNGNVTSVKWYQFKIPIQMPTKVVGNIKNFQSIRFMRVYMKGFSKPVICRFATFGLVRGEWRNYIHSLLAQGEYVPGDAGNQTKFVISTVNVEENSNRIPIPYVIPPGIKREINFGTTNYVRLNEQSLQFTVVDLKDGDARGAYKNTNFDFRQYKKIKMYVHAEKRLANEDLKDGDLTVFIRLGSDFTQNYYEYEMPLKFTPWYTSSADPNAIWPEQNRMVLVLDKLIKAKQERNIAMRNPNSNVTLQRPFVTYDGKNKITVVGNPSFSDVKGILIGVRNPKRKGTNLNDDGERKDAIVWVDELRLTDFNKKPGWAGTGRLEANLSDLGRVMVSGAYTSAGFGSLDQKLNVISQNNTLNYSVATDLDLGKLFPKKTGLMIPVHFDYGKGINTPRYNPLNPDTRLNDDLNTYVNKARRDSVKNMVIDYTRRTNINFMNVRKERTYTGKKKNRKPQVYDLENFNFSFAYSQIYHHNIDITSDRLKTYQGGLGYNFNTRPKNFKPFSKSKKVSSPWLRWIRDFNIYLWPKNLSFRFNMNRIFDSRIYRNKSFGDIITRPTYKRNWTYNRDYSFKYDFSRSLSLEYIAGARAYIREPQIYPDKNTRQWEEYKREIWSQIWSMGTLQNFNQSVKITYRLPLSKLPLTDWLNSSASYQVQYNWNASPVAVQQRLGNTVENARNIQFNAAADFNRLYNKVPFLKKLNRRNFRSRPQGRIGFTQQKKSTTVKDSTKKKRNGPGIGKTFGEGALRLLMLVKKANFVYRRSDGMQLPGFVPVPDVAGVNISNGAPGLGFVLGSQKDIRQKAAQNGWITYDTILNQAYITKLTEHMSYKVNTNILNLIKIDLDGDRVFSKNYTSYYRFNPAVNDFVNYSPLEAGNFSITYPFIATSFEKNNVNNISATFVKFKANRKEIADRLAKDNPAWSGQYVYDSIAGDYFPLGYSSNQQQVMYYSFLAAYSDKDAGKISITKPFPTFPLPDWRITFSGLTNIKAIGEIFRGFNISHGYRSLLSINAWKTNIIYDPNNPGKTFDNSNNFINQYDIGVVSFFEQYSPLIGIDFTMKNSFGGKLEYKKSRNVVMSFVNNQLTEIDSKEIVIGLSYRIRGLKFSVGNFMGRRSKKYNTDLNLKLDVGIRDNKTILRRIDESTNQISAGSKQFTLNFSANYMLSQSLQFRAYFNMNKIAPYISSQLANATTSGGFTLRFNLAQ
ncbi:MAG: cell surface protein SprA [bacterium]|nr:MAG: cell surface protein SprA [bacterium]